MRPSEREFFAEVLAKVEELPEGLRERLLKLVEAPGEALEAVGTLEAIEERSDAIRRTIEEHSRD